MNCQETRERIGPLLDGDLAPETAESIRAHLAQCPACRREHSLEVKIQDLVARAWEPEPVDDLRWQRVWDGVRREISGPPVLGRPATLGWTAAAAAVVVTVLGLTWAWRFQQPPPSRLALLQEGAVQVEEMETGSQDYIPIVTQTEGRTPVVYVYEAGE